MTEYVNPQVLRVYLQPRVQYLAKVAPSSPPPLIAIFTNQYNMRIHGSRRLDIFKHQIQAMANELPGVPFVVHCATADDGFRKPSAGMWRALKGRYYDADLFRSFFVGDSAGRERDWSCADR